MTTETKYEKIPRMVSENTSPRFTTIKMPASTPREKGFGGREAVPPPRKKSRLTCTPVRP